MSTTAYDDTNIFAQILRKQTPAHWIYEDTHTIAILDIMPRAPGHTLVLPKAPSRTILEASVEDLAAVIATVQKVSEALMTLFHANGLTIQQFNETAGGQEIFHTHFHVIPRHDGTPLGPHTGKMAEPVILKRQATDLAALLGMGEGWNPLASHP